MPIKIKGKWVPMSETRGKQEHTPLPWTVGINGDDEAEGKFYLIGGNGLFFARIPRDLKEPEFRANAELIVRAVNSHQQAVDALEAISALNPENDSVEGFNEWGEADCFRKSQTIARDALKVAR